MSRGSSPVWHPFVQHALQPEFPTVVKTEGSWLVTAEGRRIVDAISSWWVITHGHRHPRIVAAIEAQLKCLDQVIFAEFTHPPAEQLARRLIEIATPHLEHVFFSDSGSTSVEVALKMALGFWKHRGETRRRIIAMEGGYHGDTVGTMSVGERGVFTADYEPLLFEVARVPFPAPGHESRTFEALEEFCSNSDSAAFVLEPLVLGAGGMRMYPPAILKTMREICAKYRVLFIADEVMTGWGRTGSMFACQQAEVAPDILCLSKGLTGGNLPLAATLCSAEIFQAHYAKDRRRMFFHSSSFTANPLACAAGLANLEVWEREPVAERIAGVAAMQAAFLGKLSSHPLVDSPRRCGTIAAFELRVSDAGYLSQWAMRLREVFRAHNVLLRPLGNTVYVMPPYCISGTELSAVYAAIEEALSVAGVAP
jgi:adenosylmethionine-8-amino-7-oxononanoate aminotransferase